VISKGYRSYEDLADPIEWVVKAGLAVKTNIYLHPSSPIMAGAKENSFKLFLFDIGLLGAMIYLSPESIMRYDYGSYKGYFVKNFVLQELISYGFNNFVTWSGRMSEIEFVLELDGNIIPSPFDPGPKKMTTQATARTPSFLCLRIFVAELIKTNNLLT